ncbi:MAG: chlorophyll synthesis pathway protein BchC [Rhizobiales bacterium]|nr:chlorophyll synthesis pathway protein BchC [Hyphomicrobiales bacterium]
METLAIVMEGPEHLGLSELTLTPPEADDVVVDVCWSGISTGTERLLYSGKMPAFPGMGYPLVPGYEAVGIVREAGKTSGRREGDMLFVPGARCYGDVHGLFGGAAARIVVPGSRTTVVAESLGEKATLLALAATAYHALAGGNAALPDLIIGHGVVGRLLARLALALGGEAPTVVEANPLRRAGALGYPVITAEDNGRRDYRTVYDASGDPGILDSLIQRLGPGGEIVLAGFYADRLSFAFPAAFMREARLRVAAEWKPDDLSAVMALIGDGRLSLDGLITHEEVAYQAVEAYDTAFNDPACLKMILDWRFCS